MPMRTRPPRLPPVILRELDGLDWKWRLGTRHWLIMVNGHTITTWPKGSASYGTMRPILNVRSDIRRAKRKLLTEVTHKDTLSNDDSRSTRQE